MTLGLRRSALRNDVIAAGCQLQRFPGGTCQQLRVDTHSSSGSRGRQTQTHVEVALRPHHAAAGQGAVLRSGCTAGRGHGAWPRPRRPRCGGSLQDRHPGPRPPTRPYPCYPPPPQLLPVRFRYGVKALGQALDPTCCSDDVSAALDAARIARRGACSFETAGLRRSVGRATGCGCARACKTPAPRLPHRLSSSQLPPDHHIDLPLWLAQPLQERNIIDVGLPLAYKERCGASQAWRAAGRSWAASCRACSPCAGRRPLGRQSAHRRCAPHARQGAAASGRGRVVHQPQGHAGLLQRRPRCQHHVRARALAAARGALHAAA